jgi:hypothetical protein
MFHRTSNTDLLIYDSFFDFRRLYDIGVNIKNPLDWFQLPNTEWDFDIGDQFMNARNVTNSAKSKWSENPHQLNRTRLILFA